MKFSALALGLLTFTATAVHAQDAPPPVPIQTNVARDAALNPKLPTVFIVGDSTARNGADLGWGRPLRRTLRHRKDQRG